MCYLHGSHVKGDYSRNSGATRILLIHPKAPTDTAEPLE